VVFFHPRTTRLQFFLLVPEFHTCLFQKKYLLLLFPAPYGNLPWHPLLTTNPNPPSMNPFPEGGPLPRKLNPRTPRGELLSFYFLLPFLSLTLLGFFLPPISFESPCRKALSSFSPLGPFGFSKGFPNLSLPETFFSPSPIFLLFNALTFVFRKLQISLLFGLDFAIRSSSFFEPFSGADCAF